MLHVYSGMLALACVLPGLFFFHIRYWRVLSNFSSLFIKRGASDADISMLPKYIFEVSNDENQADGRARRMVPMLTNGPEFSPEGVYLVLDADCCICLCNCQDGTELCSLPCNHHFHTRCIRDWLVLRACCPLCKRELIRKNQNWKHSFD
uniref:E3 ubiquitin protein ligase RIE1-like n=1 Tax=Erigeron canadensis TaxID=72917 RepID=UPI001CB9CCB2|nr:E3 ubiquitin protein ligase RIE1-like [Erigeron canadensis]